MEASFDGVDVLLHVCSNRSRPKGQPVGRFGFLGVDKSPDDFQRRSDGNRSRLDPLLAATAGLTVTSG
ncbi:hypothetical protein SJ05684_b44710 (plasmid) [Sinorhizobium sojae CCBAU 05684]|uniref:Uncharacterized protein n=1 Tax=Sinorhizobium sojae CCBAU 05684 TaxID=716928 RepID=A0A249PHP1_9HYPH|nr:hypothetical protein SJ05684_b44710 [Sinorhizobium sojae CCBAU 05684]